MALISVLISIWPFRTIADFSWVTYFFPDLSIDNNDDHIQGHIELGHHNQIDQNGHNGRLGMICYGHKYGPYWCLWKDQKKCRSPMKTESENLHRFKSYGLIKTDTEFRAIFL